MTTQEYVGVAGALLWTETTGTGPLPVLLCHGGPGMSDNLGPVASMVDDVATVHRFDQRSCGRSTGGSSRVTVRGAIADLEALRRHWGHQRWVVGGHSWGGALALFYALAHPDRATGLLYLSGPGLEPHRRRDLVRQRRRARLDAEQLRRLDRAVAVLAERDDPSAARQVAELTWLSDFADPRRVPDFGHEPLFGYSRNDAAAAALAGSAEQRVEQPTFLDEVRRLDTPTLVLHGLQDPHPVGDAVTVARVLPRARLVTLPGVGHVPWLEDPGGVRAALRGFLAGVGG
jgi:proline iminopeptidase